MVNVNELACAYSALILADGGVDVSVRSFCSKKSSLNTPIAKSYRDNRNFRPELHIPRIESPLKLRLCSLLSPDHITKLLKAANVTVDSLWPTLFASALKTVNIKDLVKSAGSAAPAAPSVAATTAATTAAAPVEKKEEKEEKKEESDEDDGDMGFGLFD
ncbi:hypothetical protein HELRODRAFT_191019 [Helobdella robusta]|uniref:Large ribosomal subunit protein P1 n=1 Tax=Helobdella robusta TaxID=6412 RepID=T1FSI2_HELRO|nr:hypothetical protein HELRODRAFT_191019 [Helobdella robusta]ESO07703.1 hypothetical protein HELRODRAFT_191019 [Helobdella robusta]